ncbi:hypothetical protein [Croceitalea rosinachiae]|uniref:Tripartite tricarboxylate transporter TctB family protein n=1 Tax=Croceitalea rosinachiae TaxID=3075596 RepID=A0ABU3ABC3_9FLAO|nr:hypothetical protein [Croceitalea sp. F388]MDT0607130.1 hypothetical protein [Croceitalea sp. F388]
MKEQLNQRLRILITVLVTILVWIDIGWDYFHGGIPTHYLFHNQDMPGIPNWLGGIVLPIFIYYLLFRIYRRVNRSEGKESLKLVALRFLAGLLFALTISVCFMNEIMIVDYIMGVIFIMAFIFPLYKSEYYLGWVLGASFTFGAIIPIGFGSILCFLFFLFYQLAGRIKKLLKPKTK